MAHEITGIPGAFISYVREDAKHVDRLQKILEAAGIRVWRDTAAIWPGQDWKIAIKDAIETGSIAFLACFSENSQRREKSYQFAELTLAAEEMRQRPHDAPWLIPVRFSECEIPHIDLGNNRTLHSLQYVDLFGRTWERGAARLTAVVLSILGTSQAAGKPDDAGQHPPEPPPAHLASPASRRVSAERRKPAGADRTPTLFRKRMELSGAEWIGIFSQARRRIWLIGHSMARVVDLHFSGKVIAERLSAGVDVRLVVLDPFHPGSHLLEVSRQLNEVDLEQKIRNTLRDARNVEDVALQKWNANSAQEMTHVLLAPRLRLGLTQSTIHSSIVIVDDRFLVTPYSHIDEMGDEGLLLDLSASDSQQMALCSSFERDFRWHWEQSRPCPVPTQPTPKVEFRIFNHSKAANLSVSWFRRAQAKPPLPHLAVVFPTYRCLHGSRIKLSALGEEPPQGEFTHLLCPNCMYGPKLNPKNKQEMSAEEFESLLDELVDLSIPIVEISGGGEPLHHPKAAELVDVVNTLARRSKTTQFGLLSNIHSLGTCGFADAIIRAFDYTRWSWPEDAESQPSLRDRYMESIREFDSRRKTLVEQESISSPRLGIKVLATRGNVVRGMNEESPIVELVKDLFDAGVDHVRVRILRSMKNSPSRESLRIAEDDLCRELLNLQRKGLLDGDRTLEIDLKERTVARNYECALSTLICVIDPSGNMRMCWNDMDDAQRAIGNVFADGFRTAWESSRHIGVCESMDPVRVCNSLHGCHCRLIGYQELVEPASEIMREDPRTQFRDNFL